MTNDNNELSTQIAKILLEIGAVKVVVDSPITLTSGMVSPVYVDNRNIPFKPDVWRSVIDGFCQVIQSERIKLDVIAGIETSAIPHSAALAYTLGMPSVFVRKKIKDHGTKSRIEGGDVNGLKVVLIEDLVTTGGSSLAGVDALRDAGGIVEHCLAIVSYGFQEAIESFAANHVKLVTLTSFGDILTQMRANSNFDTRTLDTVSAWYDDPYGWMERKR